MRNQVTFENYHVLILHNRTNAVMIGDTLFGAEGSRHSNSCFVLALHENSGEQRLAKILFFAECIVIADNGERELQCGLQLYHGLIPISVKCGLAFPLKYGVHLHFNKCVIYPCNI